MTKLALRIALLTVAAQSFAVSTESIQLKTPRGATVEVVVSLPDKLDRKNATVVLAPGQGYHMALPILKGLAESLASHGVIAVRFNWNYFTTDPVHGDASADLSNEVQDMQTVIAFAKNDSRVDSGNLLIAGKSLGSLVSYQVFQRDNSLKALALLTPVCTSKYDEHDQPLPAPIAVGARSYPKLNESDKPILMVLGSADPNCSLPMLYDFLKDTKGNVLVDVLGGDHSWNLSHDTDPVSVQRNSENVAAGVGIVDHWIHLVLKR